MVLLIEYFKSSNLDRDREYLTCINQNIQNSLIDRIYVFISDESELVFTDNKISIIKLVKRPTFLDLFNFSNENLSGETIIIANTDIFFDESLSSINETDLSNRFLSLTRWDLFFHEGKVMMRYYDLPWRGDISSGQMSQDVWIYKSPIKIDSRSNFLMGKPGCDNRISQIIHESGYEVSNPSKNIKAYHLHQTNFRTYTEDDVIPGPYLLIEPIEDVNQKSKIKTIPHF